MAPKFRDDGALLVSSASGVSPAQLAAFTKRNGSQPPSAAWDFNGQDLTNVGALEADTLQGGDGNALGNTECDRISLGLVSTTSTPFAAGNENIVLIDATAGNKVVTLPASASVPVGTCIAIKKIDTGTNTVTVDCDGTEELDGAVAVVLNTYGDSIIVTNDGADWWILASFRFGNVEPSFAITTEVDSGLRWTDGKVVYRRGVSGNMAAGNPEIQVNTSTWGIDNPVKLWARLFRNTVSSESQYINFPGSEQPAVAADMFIGTFRKSEVILQCGAGSATYDNDPYVLFIYYTKA